MFTLTSGNTIPLALTATALIAFLSIIGIESLPNKPEGAMFINQEEQIIELGEVFAVELIVEANTPVNVFAGELHFDPNILTIDAIDYNTSVADLWAEKPWYSNGEGTLTFGGGTTKDGGFVGSELLLKVTFRAKKTGEGYLSVAKPRILKHNGLGTDATLAQPPDSIFFISQNTEANDNLIATEPTGGLYKVTQQIPSTDLNGDGKQSMADISIFMLNMTSGDLQYDFNLDGKVGIKDLNILLSK